MGFEIKGICLKCPYRKLVYVEELDGFCCEGLLNLGYCYIAMIEENEWL